MRRAGAAEVHASVRDLGVKAEPQTACSLATLCLVHVGLTLYWCQSFSTFGSNVKKVDRQRIFPVFCK